MRLEGLGDRKVASHFLKRLCAESPDIASLLGAASSGQSPPAPY